MIHSLQRRMKQSRSLLPRLLCATVWSFKSSLKYRSLVLIYQRKDGSYVNRRHDAIFVSPDVDASSYGQVVARVRDEWLWAGEISQGDVVVDVGAGVGDEVLVFSRALGDLGKVIAVEAHPRTFECLQEVIRRNFLENVTACNVAISGAPDKFSLRIGDSHLDAQLVAEDHGEVSIDAVTLPMLLDELGVEVVDLLKMNIEGAELPALLACRGHFHRFRRIVVSCHDFITDVRPQEAGMKTYDHVVKLLTDHGYEIAPPRRDSRPWVRYFVYAARR